jgi:exonuclease III
VRRRILFSVCYYFSMKIVTWNIKNFFDAGEYVERSGERLVVQEKLTLERIEYFTKEIQKADPDILFLQEVQAEEALRVLAERLSMNCFKARADHRGIATAVLHKKNIENVKVESILLPEAELPELILGEKRGTVSLRRELVSLSFSYEGKIIVCYGVHLKSALPLYLENESKEDEATHTRALGRAVLHKMGEMIALRAQASRNMREGKEVIIAGDFNESTSSTLFSILKLAPSEKEELFDVMNFVKANKTTHFYRGNSVTLDTLLISSFLRNKICEVTARNEILEDMSELPIENQRVESDHAMVILTLK